MFTRSKTRLLIFLQPVFSSALRSAAYLRIIQWSSITNLSLFPYPNACCCSDHLCFPSSLLYVDLPFCVYGSHTSAIRLWPFFIVLDIVSSLNNIPHLTPSKSLIKISCESLKLQPCRVFYPGPVHTWHSQQYAIHLSYWFIFCFPSSSLKC